MLSRIFSSPEGTAELQSKVNNQYFQIFKLSFEHPDLLMQDIAKILGCSKYVVQNAFRAFEKSYLPDFVEIMNGLS